VEVGDGTSGAGWGGGGLMGTVAAEPDSTHHPTATAGNFNDYRGD
jgi:hypothetical protein